MIAITAQGVLLAVWICFTVLALIGVIAIFVWAVRARQFSGQDHARHLPLRSDIPSDDAEPEQEEAEPEPEKADEEQGRDEHASV